MNDFTSFLKAIHEYPRETFGVCLFTIVVLIIFFAATVEVAQIFKKSK